MATSAYSLMLTRHEIYRQCNSIDLLPLFRDIEMRKIHSSRILGVKCVSLFLQPKQFRSDNSKTSGQPAEMPIRLCVTTTAVLVVRL
jgi:hypothetical protein